MVPRQTLITRWLLVVLWCSNHVTQLSGQMVNVNTTSCGVSKSCFLLPDQCSGDSCDFILTWSYDGKGQFVSFEQEGTVSSMTSWVAFGLSTDNTMGSDSVVQCVYNDQTAAVVTQMSWNINGGKSNAAIPNSQIGLVPGSVSGGYINGRITCRYQRLISVTSARRKRQADGATVYPLDTAMYYILMANGPASSGGIKQIHSQRVFSSSPINFTAVDVGSIAAAPSNMLLRRNLVKAHGILMIFAWMVFASFGMLLPRYCKTEWPGSTLCGKAVWFQLHQPCMILTLFMTVAAFIMIFVSAGTYSSYLPAPTSAHPPLGITVMILVLMNPIMAIFRCEPTHGKRIIFNIFHFIVGLLAHMCAVTTIFLGLYMVPLALPRWTIGVMSGFLGFDFLIEIILAVHMFIKKRRQGTENKTENINMGGGNEISFTEKGPLTKSLFTNLVLVFHLCGVIAFSVALAVPIGRA